MAEGTRLAQLADAVVGLQQAQGASDQALTLQQQTLERQQQSLERIMQQLAGVNTRLDNLMQNQRRQGGEMEELAPRNNDLHGIRLAVPRVEFPRFEGEDPMSWLYKANHFFAIHNTHPQHRIMLASYYMEGPALVWFQEMENARQLTSWEHLSRSIMVRFGPSAYDDPAAQFKRLSQNSTVEEYKAQFEFLSNRLPNLSAEYKLSCFLAGLREELEIPVRLANPTDVTQAFGVAKLQERFTALTHKSARISPYSLNNSQLPNHNSSKKQAQTWSSEQTHLDGVNFGVDHVLERGEVSDEWAGEQSLACREGKVEISLNAMTGSPSSRTMRVLGKLGNQSLSVLIDSGSTHCFIAWLM